jgi:hypothetical protein
MAEWLDISRNRRSTMKTTTKTLILTARVVSGVLLGSGSAMAQNLSPPYGYTDGRPANVTQVQSGSSDADAHHIGFQLGVVRAAPPRPSQPIVFQGGGG